MEVIPVRHFALPIVALLPPLGIKGALRGCMTTFGAQTTLYRYKLGLSFLRLALKPSLDLICLVMKATTLKQDSLATKWQHYRSSNSRNQGNTHKYLIEDKQSKDH